MQNIFIIKRCDSSNTSLSNIFFFAWVLSHRSYELHFQQNYRLSVTQMINKKKSNDKIIHIQHIGWLRLNYTVQWIQWNPTIGVHQTIDMSFFSSSFIFKRTESKNNRYLYLRSCKKFALMITIVNYFDNFCTTSVSEYACYVRLFSILSLFLFFPWQKKKTEIIVTSSIIALFWWNEHLSRTKKKTNTYLLSYGIYVPMYAPQDGQ